MTELRVDLAAPTPVYEQIRAQVAGLVAVGALEPGARLPASRDLARDLGVAVGTVQRAYRELEAAGVVVSRRRSGTVVAYGGPAGSPPADGTTGAAGKPAGDAATPARGSAQALLDDARALVRRARRLGVGDGELVDMIRALQARTPLEGS